MNPKITLVGRVGQNPESMGSGVRFRVVTNDSSKNDAGKWEDKNTSWWTVKAWRSLAQQAQILKKGQEVIITGTIAEDNWTDSSGNKRSSYEITADNIAVTTFTLTKDSDAPVQIPSDENDPWAAKV